MNAVYELFGFEGSACSVTSISTRINVCALGMSVTSKSDSRKKGFVDVIITRNLTQVSSWDIACHQDVDIAWHSVADVV